MDRKDEKLIIAGAGPAGVSAALYAARSGLTPLVLITGFQTLYPEKSYITMEFPRLKLLEFLYGKKNF